MRVLLLVAATALVSCGPSLPGDEDDGVTIAQVRSGLALASVGGCNTTIASALNDQLIEELNCIKPRLLVNFTGSHVTLYSAVIPWLAADAAKDLKDATVARGERITISSAYRTLAQQYLLYKWWQAGQCGIQLAAVPGTSNHQSGRAIDTPYYSAWRSALGAQGWSWLGSSDVVHFNHLASRNVSSVSVLAFQKLWNKNHSTGRLAEDGSWGPATASAMARSPTTGFARHGCPTTGKLTGTVTQQGTTKALSGVVVTAGGKSVTTGTAGTFSFELPPGSVTVTAAKTGFVTAKALRTVVLGSTVSASLALTPVATTGTVRGTVVDASGAMKPLPGTLVLVGSQMLSTDAAGAFQTVLPAGAVRWSVSRAGFASASGTVTVTAGATTTLPIALHPSTADEPPQLVILGPGPDDVSDLARVVVSGTAVDDTTTLTSVKVLVNGGAVTEVPVQLGEFSAEVTLTPGANTVVVTARDALGQEGSATWAGTFRAGFGGDVHRFDDAASILSGAALELFDPDTGTSLGQTTSDSEGHYELVASAPGVKRLHVEHQGYTPRDLVVEVSADERTTVDVGLTPGESPTPSIRFIEPTSEGPFDASELTISGVVDGLEVSSVAVNGTPAQLMGNGFLVTLPLPEGTTTFEAVAESAEGQSVRASLRATRLMPKSAGGCEGCAGAPGLPLILFVVALVRRRGSPAARRHDAPPP
ncbi:MAG: carboxypeptidase regulatory-like domain-containing protein [Myxococcaceae bacterium]|nr:carboxypeptidase regulatory-like domain-containing protein [Myxococcaceae bacterium]